MKNRKLFIFYFIFILFSCEKKTREVLPIQTHSINNIKQKKESDLFKTLKINIKNIKNQIDDVTTGFLSKKETDIFIKKPKNIFFGFYYLIKENPSNVVGKMIVYDDINPYKYNKNTDEFIEINLWKKGVKLFNNSIEVGMSKELLIARLGNKFKIENNILIYNNKSIKGFFKIKNDSVTNIKIGLYRKNTPNKQILKYEW